MNDKKTVRNIIYIALLTSIFFITAIIMKKKKLLPLGIGSGGGGLFGDGNENKQPTVVNNTNNSTIISNPQVTSPSGTGTGSETSTTPVVVTSPPQSSTETGGGGGVTDTTTNPGFAVGEPTPGTGSGNDYGIPESDLIPSGGDNIGDNSGATYSGTDQSYTNTETPPVSSPENGGNIGTGNDITNPVYTPPDTGAGSGTVGGDLGINEPEIFNQPPVSVNPPESIVQPSTGTGSGNDYSDTTSPVYAPPETGAGSGTVGGDIGFNEPEIFNQPPVSVTPPESVTQPSTGSGSGGADYSFLEPPVVAPPESTVPPSTGGGNIFNDQPVIAPGTPVLITPVVPGIENPFETMPSPEDQPVPGIYSGPFCPDNGCETQQPDQPVTAQPQPVVEPPVNVGLPYFESNQPQTGTATEEPAAPEVVNPPLNVGLPYFESNQAQTGTITQEETPAAPETVNPPLTVGLPYFPSEGESNAPIETFQTPEIFPEPEPTPPSSISIGLPNRSPVDETPTQPVESNPPISIGLPYRPETTAPQTSDIPGDTPDMPQPEIISEPYYSGCSPKLGNCYGQPGYLVSSGLIFLGCNIGDTCSSNDSMMLFWKGDTAFGTGTMLFEDDALTKPWVNAQNWNYGNDRDKQVNGGNEYALLSGMNGTTVGSPTGQNCWQQSFKLNPVTPSMDAPPI